MIVSDETQKHLHIMFVAAALMSKAGNHFKKDNVVYKNKTKRLFNQIFNDCNYILKLQEKSKSKIATAEYAKEFTEFNKKELDVEAEIDEFNEEQELLSKLIALYIRSKTYTTMIDTEIVINQLLDNKKVYTEIELLDKLNTAVNYYSNFKVDKENLKKFI